MEVQVSAGSPVTETGAAVPEPLEGAAAAPVDELSPYPLAPDPLAQQPSAQQPSAPQPLAPAGKPSGPVAIKVPSTRASRAWLRIVPTILLLAVILLFVFENLHNVKVSFVGFSGTVPLALALLAAAALGALLVLALGSVRMLQLRKVIRHYSKAASGKPN